VTLGACRLLCATVLMLRGVRTRQSRQRGVDKLQFSALPRSLFCVYKHSECQGWWSMISHKHHFGCLIVRGSPTWPELLISESLDFSAQGVCSQKDSRDGVFERCIVAVRDPRIFIWHLLMMAMDVSGLPRRSFVKINLARAQRMEYRSTA
jgi:hypothetical protein